VLVEDSSHYRSLADHGGNGLQRQQRHPREARGTVVLASNLFGKSVRVNIIHDLDANTLTVYVDGMMAWTGGAARATRSTSSTAATAA
jgi:hypothetical protein